MPRPFLSRQRRTSFLALLLSCGLHLALLLLPRHEPVADQGAPSPIQARLLPAPTVPKAEPAAVVTPPAPPAAPTRTPARRSTPSAAKPNVRAQPPTTKAPSAISDTPTWTAAEKAEMENFLDNLARTPQPTLAQRALAMAREQGQQMAAQDASEDALLEMRPNAPPVHPFSLESYLNGLVRHLNRSATAVQRDTRDPGIQPAAIRFKLNPDGSLRSFEVLNAGDQAAEIAFIRAVIDRAIPFLPFPPDIDRAARSIGITICIRPGSGDGGLGFTRMSGNRC
ncbi:MAG: hypothetical protein Q7J47_07715 [Azoarcus sp.]|nr:hypothetical protein [Azoarcus sp.]